MRNIFAKIVLFLIGALLPGIALATYDKLPETMVGQTTVIQEDRKYYGGFTGNEAVYNYTSNTGQTVGTQYSPYLRFDGADDFVDMGNVDLNFNQEISVEAWINIDAYPTDGFSNIVGKWIAGTPAWSTFYFYIIGSGKAVFAVKTDNNSGNNANICSNIVMTNNQIPLDSWHLLTGTYEVGDNKAKIYIDGAEVLTTVASNNAVCNPTIIQNYNDSAADPHLTIGASRHCTEADNDGCSPDPYGETFFKGGIDEVKIYRRVLSSNEITNHFHGEFSEDNTSAKQPIGLWRFNDETGSTATDSSTSGFDGTLKNFNYNANSGWVVVGGPVSLSSGERNIGYDNFGFDKNFLIDCVNGILLGGGYRCFVSNTAGTTIKVMTSRTYVKGVFDTRAVLELSTLHYNKAPIVTGDVYLGSGGLDSLEYWGRNLAQGNGTFGNAFWNISGSPSGNSQSSMSGSPFVDFKDKINQLKSEARTLSSNPTSTAHLQSSNIELPPNGLTTFDDSNKYPEGKIWYKNSNTTLGNVTYHGKGTIIVQGNLNINGDIEPADNNSRLGIIVIGGTVTIAGNKTVRASILSVKNGAVGGGITFGGNNTSIIGSLVAEGNVGMTNRVNIRITYDRLLDSYWPPGFRTLNIPKLFENY